MEIKINVPSSRACESRRAARSRRAAPTRLCQSSAGSSSSNGTRLFTGVSSVSSSDCFGFVGSQIQNDWSGRHHEGSLPSSASGKRRAVRASTARVTRGSTSSSPARRRTSGAKTSLGASSSLIPARLRTSNTSGSSSEHVKGTPSSSNFCSSLGAAQEDDAEDAASDGGGCGGVSTPPPLADVADRGRRGKQKDDALPAGDIGNGRRAPECAASVLPKKRTK